MLLWPVSEARAACTSTGTNQTCTNSGVISSIGNGITDTATLTLTNTSTGLISAVFDGVHAANANVSNFGDIRGDFGISAITTANVNNAGNVLGDTFGIFAATANVTNSGTISATISGAISATTANVSNTGTISGPIGIGATIANVTNAGTISGSIDGISANTANVVNSGAITGGAAGDGITSNSATVVNSGTISGFGGIAAGVANITNFGIISGGGFGISSLNHVTVTNFGTISAGETGIGSLGSAIVINSGTISGGTGALSFGGASDTLTLLPGSHIVGAINLDGGGDTVNVLTGNQNLTFDTLAGATVTSNVPFVVSGNRIVTIDPTPFAMADRNLMDFSRAVSSAVPDVESSATTATAAADSGSALAFAGPDTSPLSGDDRFPGLSAYVDDSMLPFKSPTLVYGNGTALWARGFVGERVQDAAGTLLETHNRFYGGMLGGGWQVRPNLRLGLFLGAGETRSTIDTYGETKSTLVFAGLTGHYTWGASFLRFGLQGGHSSNDTTRSNINNNLVPGGLETATASFDGWYITPEATFGHHFALGSVGGGVYTLTPSLTVRYLHASFDGYTESGTTAPLTVGDRSADAFEERGQLKLIRTQTFAPTEILKTSIFGGVLADQRVGGDTVDAVLLGQAIPFATPGDDSVWGGFGGLGLEWSTGRVTLFASTEYLALSDSSSVISGQGGVRIAF
jgi:hypothetical protein